MGRRADRKAARAQERKDDDEAHRQKVREMTPAEHREQAIYWYERADHQAFAPAATSCLERAVFHAIMAGDRW